MARLAANPRSRPCWPSTHGCRADLLRRMGRAEFLRLDIRRPTIAKAIASYNVDTVVHAATSIMEAAPHSTAIKEFNLIGSMQVCAACQRSPSVKRVVLRSTAMVYGASSKDPSHFDEGTTAVREPKVGYGRDLLDVGGYVRGLARRRQDIDITIVRPQAILGPRINTRMGSYLSLPVVPRSSAWNRACSSCTRRTHSRRWSTRCWPTGPAPTTWRATAWSPDPGDPAARAYPDARAQRAAGADNGRVPGLAFGQAALESDRLPHVRQGPGHHPDADEVRVHAALHDRPDAGGFHPPRLIESGHQGPTPGAASNTGLSAAHRLVEV